MTHAMTTGSPRVADTPAVADATKASRASLRLTRARSSPRTHKQHKQKAIVPAVEIATITLFVSSTMPAHTR